ncbi:MAG TPA: serine/threonine-protein kinase [Candidatus Binatia bacterium]|nr:serine/threonine-protein kinase [Candidatus Binatia bacterium]
MAPGGDTDPGAGAAPAGESAVVTLRQLPRELLGDPEFLRRFRSEAPIVARLDPTYVVRTRAHVEDAFGLSLVTDYVDGLPLRSILPAATARHPEAALVVLRDALLGLEAAHREGILHRDLRPERIIVDRHGIARITDLGLVARTPSNRWIPGTPEYMAPELWADEEPTIATDVYAAAVVLFECVSGAPPFRGGAVVIREQHLSAALPVHDLPREITSLVLTGMARSPEQRYARAWDFAEEVEDAGRALSGTGWQRRGRRRLAAAVATALPPSLGTPGAEERRGLIGRAHLPWHSRI